MEFLVEKRSKIVNELISTESAYLDHLNLILKFFVDPLLCSRLIPPKEVTTIFGDIKSIRLLNQVLFDHLRITDVSGAFSQLIHFLKLYSAYARNFPSSQSLLTRLIDNNNEFRRFVEKQENLPALRGLKLPALLITPIQRIPRYKLLLEQLYAATDTESEHKRELFCILQQINEVVEQINNCVEDFDNCNQIIALQRCLDGCTPKLLLPGRKLLKTGQLVKVARNGAFQQARHFWLFTDILLYAKNNPRKLNSYLCSGVFPLRHCFVERVIGRNMFIIKCKSETLLLLAPEYGILDDWVNSLETAIKNLLDSRRTLRKESSSSNPLRRNILKANKRRHCSSLSEKFRFQNLSVAKTKTLPERTNQSRRFLIGVRKRVLQFVRKRSAIASAASPKENVSQNPKKRRVVTRSPILSIVEEEELKRISVLNTGCKGAAGGSPDFHSPTEKSSKRPWWDEETAKTLQNSNKKSRCCFKLRSHNEA